MELQKNIKFKLLGYLLISIIGFSYLVFIHNAGVSIPIFVIIQFVCLYFLMPRKKPLLLFIPIFILSLNWFISASTIWQISNFFVIIGLFSVMSLWAVGEFSVKGGLFSFISNILVNAFKPFQYFRIPIKWLSEINKERTTTIQRVLIGIGISIPFLIFILVVLSSADEIFARSIEDFFATIFARFRMETFFRVAAGWVSGFYLFGIIYLVYLIHIFKPNYESAAFGQPVNDGDPIIINIVLGSILVIYTLFVVIQFRYLFAASGSLPYGLNFVEYARRGFFELLFLSVVNITIILVVVLLTKNQKNIGMKICKSLCCYLCIVTMILLISSFYRMFLYSAEFGLTRLRFLVFGFLIFEAIGLIFTQFYIIKPKFNIIAVYSVIALSYYLLLNVVPMDAFIARNQVNRYFRSGGDGIGYVLTLSADAAGEISLLYESNYDTRQRVRNYYARVAPSDAGWRQWNLSTSRVVRYRGLTNQN